MAGEKRVLMVAPTPYFSDRGCHVQIYEVARSQQLNGNDVQIVTYHLGRDMPGIPTYRTMPIPWYNKHEAGPSLHKLYIDPLLFLKTLVRAIAYKPDVLHAHLHEGAAIALPIARLLNVPVVLDMQGSLTGELVNHQFIQRESLAYRGLRVIERQIHRRVDALLMWTYIGQSLCSQFDFEEHKVIPVDYGVDLAAFRPHSKDLLDDLYVRLGLPRDRAIVVYLGLLSKYQGIDCLLESIPKVLRSCPNTHFLIMGYPNEATYREKARQLGVLEHVTFPGRIEYSDAARFLSLGDVAVSPKLTAMEGNGKLLNYLACGLPTVAFDLPGNVAVLGDVGTFAAVGSADELANATISLLADPVKRLELAHRSRELAERRYSWKSIGSSINDAYETIIARHKARSRKQTSGSETRPTEPK